MNDLFTGKERDTESENDYFGARYFGSSMGRFMSPDPSGLDFADLGNPTKSEPLCLCDE
jgi:RHS repeat-associated protein